MANGRTGTLSTTTATIKRTRTNTRGKTVLTGVQRSRTHTHTSHARMCSLLAQSEIMRAQASRQHQRRCAKPLRA